MKTIRRIAALLLVCLLGQTMTSVPVHAAGRTVGEAGLALIEKYETYFARPYASNGKYYIGYGTPCEKDAYPNGITRQEAEALLRRSLAPVEEAVSAFYERAGVTPPQREFDALVSFSQNLGTAWLSGDSPLTRIAAGAQSATRLETARAFGAWCHAGGAVSDKLAARRLEEAAIYLDGDTAAAGREFAYLAIAKEDDVTYATDFSVYQRGGKYEDFPLMFRLGYTLAGVKDESGRLIRLGDTVRGNLAVSAAWRKNDYTARQFSDVKDAHWFYDYVMELSEAEVVSGYPDGTYLPEAKVSTGETLKLVLRALGVAPQGAPEGAHWAQGYADYARARGYLAAAQTENLNAPLTRAEVARFTAKALGFSQANTASPFDDTRDGYATALYAAGILTGAEGEDGKLLFYPREELSRAEIATIVWRLYRAAALGTKQTLRHTTSYSTYTLDILESVPRFSYDRDAFSGSGREMSYAEPGVTVRRGIDVSRFQGDIDWAAVRADGVEFAILRVGGRYQQSGELYDDARFEEYYRGARAAGLTVGVYFYSQAITAAEAREEADYVLEKLAGKTVDGPVVFDWETAGYASARTYGIETGVLCDCAAAFCESVRAAGHRPMIYFTKYDGYIKYDLSRLTAYDFWYADDYGGAAPLFFYDFRMWQYTNKGTVNGIKGSVDMDLWFERS